MSSKTSTTKALCGLVSIILFGSILPHVSAGSGSGHWINDALVYDDVNQEESWPSMATDSNNNLYVAYQHYDSGFERYRIYISKSTDGGITWTLFHKIEKDTSLLHPSIAIDPHNDNIYISYEDEKALNDHDILCSKYTPSSGWLHTNVDIDSGDDRYPSITSDYQFGPSNYQYISYEYIHSQDNRDLRVSRSTTHGDSWSLWHVKNLGSNLVTQTSITTSQDGHVYVAYVVGSTYNSEKWLDVDWGDRASTDDEFEHHMAKIYDDPSHGASWPSIAASHSDPKYIVIAFQRKETSLNDDVYYCRTSDRGLSWNNGPIANSGYNERHPVITVDGQGSSSTAVLGYFRVAYYYGKHVHYKQAWHTTPGSWSEHPSGSNPISDGGTGDNDQERGIAITTRRVPRSSSPNVAWTDDRRSILDLYTSTPYFEASPYKAKAQEYWKDKLFVAMMYGVVFERLPDQEGYDYWTGVLEASQLTWEEMLDLWFESPEWESRFGGLTNNEFVTKVYEEMLGRSPDAEGLVYWVTKLDSQEITRAEMIIAFYYSAEYQTLSTQERMLFQLYIGLTDSVPDETEFESWMDDIESGYPRDSLIDDFWSTYNITPY